MKSVILINLSFILFSKVMACFMTSRVSLLTCYPNILPFQVSDHKTSSCWNWASVILVVVYQQLSTPPLEQLLILVTLGSYFCAYWIFLFSCRLIHLTTCILFDLQKLLALGEQSTDCFKHRVYLEWNRKCSDFPRSVLISMIL